MSFDILCHLTFCVISHFVSFHISCDLSDISHYCNHSHQSHCDINAQVVVEDRCVLKKWPALRIVIGRYGYKSSFGANNTRDVGGGAFSSGVTVYSHGVVGTALGVGWIL